jgi:hypothetical protein
MKALSKIAVGAVAAVGLGFAAVAFSHGPGMGYGGMGYGGMGYGPGGGYGMGMQGPYGGGYGMHGPYAGAGFGGMHGPNGFAGYDEKTLSDRLTSLKGDLKITKEQTKAWETFEAAVRNQAKSWEGIRESMQAGQVTPESHYALMQAQFAGREAVWKARADLYSVLTNEQKAQFDGAGPGPYGRRGYRG